MTRNSRISADKKTIFFLIRDHPPDPRSISSTLHGQAHLFQ
jgi:hypothetical protein